MKKYKVKVFKHLLKNNKIAKKGDEVKENQLINPLESVKGGFVEEVSSKDSKKKATDNGKAATDNGKTEDANGKAATDNGKTEDANGKAATDSKKTSK